MQQTHHPSSPDPKKAEAELPEGTDAATAPPPAPGEPPLSGPVAMFVQVTQSLMELIKRETSLLEERRPREIEPLQGEKARLTAEHQKLLNVLRMNETELLGPKDSPIRKHLRSVMETFRRVVAYHARLVGRLKTVCEGIVNAISDEASRQRQTGVQHYGRDARVAYGPRGNANTLSYDSRV